MIRNDFHNVRYGIKEGFPISQKYAQPAGEIMDKLEKKNELTAQNLVDVSRDEDAPLHGYFEWDDEIAAEKYRVEQGRLLIRAIVRIDIPDNDNDKPKTVKVYYAPDRDDPHYSSIETIMQNEDKAQKLYSLALSELRSFERRYAVIENKLSGVFREIKKLET